MQFRGDIEGLRGVAVILVVLAHAKVPGLAGGFVGVDVFFVISGYLITGLLLEQLKGQGRIDAWEFYARRARRLVPALWVLVASVATMAAVMLPPDLLEPQIKAAFFAILWAANLYFPVADVDYFGESASSSLLLHTWSLGVEEQFYLVWPWLLLAGWRWRQRTVVPMAGLAICSLVLCLLMARTEAIWAYYSMPTRLWQLAVGGLAFVLAARTRGQSGVFAAAMASLGWGLLLGSLWQLRDMPAYPSVWALLPTAAAAAWLVAGAHGLPSPMRPLNWAWLRFSGRISYSWYLWHWPVLSFASVLGLPALSASGRFGLVALSMVLGWLSYRFVEQPFRHSRTLASRELVVASLVACVATAALLNIGQAFIGREPTAVDPAKQFRKRVQALVSTPRIYREADCDQWYRSDQLVPCEFAPGAPGGATIVLVGDSVGVQWLPALEQLARKRGLRLVVLTKSSCAIVDQPFVYERIKRRFTECERWRARTVDYIRNIRPELVIMGSTSAYPFTAEEWREGSRRQVEMFAAHAGAVAVLAPTPTLTFDALRCVTTQGHWDGQAVLAPGCQVTLADAEPAEVINSLRQALARVDGGHLIYLNDLVCPEGRCDAVREGQLVFRDNQHVNASFAEALAPVLDHRLAPALEAGLRR